MADTKLGYRTWAVAIYLVCTNLTGISRMKPRRELDISQKSAWHLAHRLREAWSGHVELFGGPVEFDEAYIGGKGRNQHERKQLRAGRGPVGKQPEAGACDRAQRLVNVSDWIRVVTREALDCDCPADGAGGLPGAPTGQAQAAG